ncbi:MAG: tetratricopeptide repeat protein [Sedimenticola sp.]
MTIYIVAPLNRDVDKMKKMILTITLLLCWIPLSSLANEEWIAEAYAKSFDYEQRENHRQAIHSLARIYEQYPKGYTVNLRLGWLHYLLGKYANSIEHYRVAIQSYPNAAEPKLGLMLPLLVQLKYEEVVITANQIIRDDPYNYFANLRLTIALKAQGKTESALAVANKMLAQYPTDTVFIEHAAVCQELLGNKELAIALFQGLHILDPDSQTALQFLSNK